MNVPIEVIEKQLKNAAACFADLVLETHLRKAPRMESSGVRRSWV